MRGELAAAGDEHAAGEVRAVGEEVLQLRQVRAAEDPHVRTAAEPAAVMMSSVPSLLASMVPTRTPPVKFGA